MAGSAPPLIGRTNEVSAFRTALERGTAHGVVLAGAAGVGKTRLARELLRAAEETGYESLRVTATEAGRAIPLGPFAHLLPAEPQSAGEVQLMLLVRAAISERARQGGLALLVDDAHLLDPASALLVQQLAGAGEALVVATVRSGESAPDAVVALWKDHGCEHLELLPLSREDTGLLVESLVAGEVDGQTGHRLWDASRGLPLVACELVRFGVEHGLLARRDGLWRWRGPLQLGGRLQELIDARIGQLDELGRTVLELVALGEPLSWSLLAAGEASAAEGLLRRGVLASEPSRRRVELRPAHPLFGESVRARIPSARAAALQARLADWLEASGLRRAGDLLRLALWRLDSGTDASAELLLEAARTAERSLDSVLAERLALAAAEAGGGSPAERILARSLVGQGRSEEAEEMLRPLEATARTDEQRAWVTLARARNLLVGLGRADDAEAALAGALLQVSEPSLRGELGLTRCWVLSRRGRSKEAAAASLELAETGTDDGFRLRAVGIAAHALVWAGRPDDALALVGRWQARADELGELITLVPAQFRTAYGLALLLTGRLEEGAAAADEAYARFVGDRTTEVTALVALGCGLVALTRGRLRTASRWLHESCGYLRESDPTGTLPLALGLTAQALGQAGDAVEAGRAAAAAENAARPGGWLYDADVLLGRAWAAAAEGALTEARRTALAAVDLAREQSPGIALRAAHDLVRLGDAMTAASCLTDLAREMQGPLADACAEHARAAVSGEARSLERAAADFSALGALLWAAEAESTAAAAHRRNGREASAHAASVRATLLLEQLEGARTPPLALAGPVEELTPREREVTVLAAGGASNREIAERLVVSVRTVENHLQRAYRKLGVGSRRELPGLLRAIE